MIIKPVKPQKLLLPLVFTFFAMVLCMACFAYTDTENVAYVDGTYTVTGAETTEQGRSPDFPFTVLSDAYKSLYETGGTVVVCGKTMTDSGFSSSITVKHTTPIYFTSTFEGTDYASENDARIVMYKAIHFHGDVTFENITFSTSSNIFIHGNGHKLVFGDGINVLYGTAGDENRTNSDGEYVDSQQYLVVRGGGEGVAYDGDLYLEFNSGRFSAIHAGTKRYSVGGDVNLIVNTPNITYVNLGNDVAKDADGNIYTGAEYRGDVNVSLNSGGTVKFALNYIDKIGGSINIALNNGSKCGTDFALVPDGGTYIVEAGKNGTIENLGGGHFRAVADEGYVVVIPADTEYCSTTEGFATKAEFKPTVYQTKVDFINRQTKPAPVGVYAYPASDNSSSNGELRGTNPSMEYRVQGSDNFTAITSTSVTGLAPATYEVRYVAESGYDAGEIGVYVVTGRGADYVINEALAAREAKIAEVRSATSSLDTSAYNNVYYVSTSGTDKDDLKIGSWVIKEYGKSADTAYKTLAFAKSKAQSGDLILLKRGDIWRERMSMVAGVDYSSYGDTSLDMPFIYGSPENGTDSSKWTLVEGTDNIWQYATTLTDVGVIVFNDGAENSIKEIPDYYDGTYYVRGSGATEEFDILTHLDNDLEHFNLYTGTQKSVYLPAYDGNTTLYLRCDRGNPGEVFSSIEFNTRTNVVSNASGCHWDNIGIKYGGAHGIGGTNAMDLTVTNCEICWIGGVVQYYAKSSAGEFGTVTRYGNGIEIWQNCDGFTIEDCYIYQCYDAGITNQGRGINTTSLAAINAYMNDVYFCDNLLEYNVYNIEYFLSQIADEEDYTAAGFSFPMMTNINYTGNLCFYAGYGFGKQRPNSGLMTHIRTGGENPAEGFVIENNLFFDALDYVAYTVAGKQEWLPNYEANTYVQKRGSYAGAQGISSAPIKGYFNDDVRDFYTDIMYDTTPEVIFLENVSESIRAVTNEARGMLYVTSLDGYTEISFDGGETWEIPAEKNASFPIEKLGENGVLARAVSRGNDSKQSEIVALEIVPMAATDEQETATVNTFNSPGEDIPAFFDNGVLNASENFTIVGDIPNTAYLNQNAESLASALKKKGVNVRFYFDVNLDGQVSFADFTSLIKHFAAEETLADENTADINFDKSVSLADLSQLIKNIK